jgi:hypothetical protein
MTWLATQMSWIFNKNDPLPAVHAGVEMVMLVLS